MEAEGDSFLVVHVEGADAPVRVRAHQALRGEDVGDAGIDLSNRPPVDDLPVRIGCRPVVHGTCTGFSCAA